MSLARIHPGITASKHPSHLSTRAGNTCPDLSHTSYLTYTPLHSLIAPAASPPRCSLMPAWRSRAAVVARPRSQKGRAACHILLPDQWIVDQTMTIFSQKKV